jgi:uncharacterized protein (DUF1330 family)
MVVKARITDPQRFAAYGQAVPPLVARHGGRYLVLGGPTLVLEGESADVKTVVSEWPSQDAALAFWNSPEYRAARELRAGTGEFSVVLVDGVA